MRSNWIKFFVMRFFLFIIFLIMSGAYGHTAAFAESASGGEFYESNGFGSGEFDEFDGFDDFAEFDEFDVDDVAEVYDPLNGYNRFMTGVNDYIYVWMFKPVAKGYSFIVKEPVRHAINRMFANGLYPVRLVNNLLQLKVKRAGIETGRFCVNTTLGFAGLFDPAKECMGLEAYPEDFGQTLGFYGVGNGFHIVVPIMGPSNLRDLFGFFPDAFLRPMTYVNDFRATIAVTVVDHFNTLSLYVDLYDKLRTDAFDLYVFQRDAYETRRQKAIEE